MWDYSEWPDETTLPYAILNAPPSEVLLHVKEPQPRIVVIITTPAVNYSLWSPRLVKDYR